MSDYEIRNYYVKAVFLFVNTELTAPLHSTIALPLIHPTVYLGMKMTSALW